MISKRDLKKLAKRRAISKIKYLNLEQLFGKELYDLGYKPKGDWVHEILQEVQDQIVGNIVK